MLAMCKGINNSQDSFSVGLCFVVILVLVWTGLMFAFIILYLLYFNCNKSCIYCKESDMCYNYK